MILSHTAKNAVCSPFMLFSFGVFHDYVLFLLFYVPFRLFYIPFRSFNHDKVN